MSAAAVATQPCPSCGTEISSASGRCGICRSGLVLCPSCRSLCIAGTVCLQCGDGAEASVAAEASEKPSVPASRPSLDYAGGAAGLIPLLFLRLALWGGFVAALLIALRRTGLTALTPVTAAYEPEIAVALPILWTIVLGCLPVICYLNGLIRRYRLNRTLVFGQPVSYQPRFFARMGNLILNLFYLAITAGLAFPWIFARNRRSFYRSCAVGRRARYALGFSRSGPEILGYWILTLFYLPMTVLSLGLLRPFISWIWVGWEQSSLLVPGRSGEARRVVLTGGFWSYAACVTMWWVLSVLSLGILRPWAVTAEWKWIARHSAIARGPA